MSRAFEPAIINICLDRLYVEVNFTNESVRTNLSSFQQILRRSNGHKVEVIKLGKLVKSCFKNKLTIGWMWTLNENIHMSKFGKPICEIFNSKFMPLLLTVKVH